MSSSNRRAVNEGHRWMRNDACRPSLNTSVKLRWQIVCTSWGCYCRCSCPLFPSCAFQRQLIHKPDLIVTGAPQRDHALSNFVKVNVYSYRCSQDNQHLSACRTARSWGEEKHCIRAKRAEGVQLCDDLVGNSTHLLNSKAINNNRREESSKSSKGKSQQRPQTYSLKFHNKTIWAASFLYFFHMVDEEEAKAYDAAASYFLGRENRATLQELFQPFVSVLIHGPSSSPP